MTPTDRAPALVGRARMKHDDFAPRIGPWGAPHFLGAAVVLLIAMGIALTIWPGWSRIGAW